MSSGRPGQRDVIGAPGSTKVLSGLMASTNLHTKDDPRKKRKAFTTAKACI
ncbi:hypothetical protein Pcac1_g24925 [Phytophthora cactorum]|nr:hypothetical protein Pcac1_g24925 [Phytophthora cactorum]